MELEKSRNLTATLENDLERVQQEASNAFDPSAMSVAGTYVSRYPQSSFGGGRRGRSSPTSSIISGFDPSGHGPTKSTLEALRAGEPVGGGSGILPMVTAQRDRFKKKNSELEAELQKSYQTVSSLRSEIASLQKDNLNLYEKTRYVSTYNRGGHSTASSAYAGNSATIQMGDTTSDRYRAAYESNISPFAQFRGRETARAMKRMSLPERVILRITRFALATRTSRNLFALYLLGLHFMIFWMLFWTSTVEIEKHAANLGDLTGAAPAGGAAGGPGDEWHQEGFQEGG